MNYPRIILDARLEQGGGANVVLDTTCKGVEVPPGSVTTDRIVLNLDLRKQPDLMTDEDGVAVTLSFGGQIHQVSFPWISVVTIHCEEFVVSFDPSAVLARVKAEQDKKIEPSLTNVVPMKKPNPFKVVPGGKEGA